MTITQCDWWSTHTQWVIERHSRDVLIGHDASHTHTPAYTYTHTLHKPKQHIHPTHTRTHTDKCQHETKTRHANETPINKRKSREKNTRDEIGPLSLRSLITRRASTPPSIPGWWLLGDHSAKFGLPPYALGGCACVCVWVCVTVYLHARKMPYRNRIQMRYARCQQNKRFPYWCMWCDATPGTIIERTKYVPNPNPKPTESQISSRENT